jgi:signal transduction histidine kinase
MTAIKRCSLRERLLRAILIPLAVCLFGIGFLSFYASTDDIEALDDAQLLSHAKIIRSLMDHELHEDEPSELNLLIKETTLDYRYEKNLAYRVWFKGKLILHSPSSANFPDAPGPDGFSTRAVQNTPWRFYTQYDNDLNVITEVSELVSLRREQGYELLLSLFAPQLLLFPAIIILVSIGIKIGLTPIQRLADQVRARSAQDLTPVGSDVIPAEVSPFINAVNELMARLERVIANERSFTGNAAHELRTPLAAIKAQAQVAAMATTPDERAILLRDLASGVDRATHLVDQMLELARLDETSPIEKPYDISATTAETVLQQRNAAQTAGVQIKSHITPGLIAQGHREAASVLVKNLIENAIKYTPAKGEINISLAAENNVIALTVADTGVGISTPDKQAALERFVRFNKGEQPGAGLGLAIVQRAVELHHGQLTLSDPPNGSGLVVRVTLPRAA